LRKSIIRDLRIPQQALSVQVVRQMGRASITVLAKEDIEKVHECSLRILDEVGLKVESPAVLEMLGRAGARVDASKHTAYLGERMVSQALETTARPVRISSRGGEDYLLPQEGVQLVSPDGQPAAVLDLDTGKRRPSTLRDVIDFAILCDALPEVGYIWPPVVATDMPSERSSYYEFLATITHSSKHVQHGTISPEEAAFHIEVASAIAGSSDELRKRPIFSEVITPITPLRYDPGSADAMVVLARAGVPIVQLSMGIAGLVTPATVAGTLAVVNAENLAGITIAQVANPGSPSLYSSFCGVVDLRSGVFLCGTPESILMDAAAAEMARHYGLPSCAGGTTTSARAISAETGYQTAMSAMGGMLVGADMLVGLGGLDRDAMVSKEKLVMDCELWRWLKRLREGVLVDDATLGFDSVKRQGPGGAFLSDPHTLKYIRKDLMVPQVTAFHAPGDPGQVRDDLVEHARKRTKEILSTHKPALLSKEQGEKVAAIAKRHGIVLKDGQQVFAHE